MSLKARIIPAAVLAVLLAGGSAYQINEVATPVVEGTRLVAYADVGGVPTICSGVTQGVKLGQRETALGCKRLDAAAIKVGLQTVERCAIAPTPMPESMKAAWGLFTYNVGSGNFCTSTAAKLIRAGRYRNACAELPRWRYVAGKDCALASSKCAGIIERRELERTLCEWDL